VAAVNLSMSDQSGAMDRIICWSCQEIVCQMAHCSSCHSLLPKLNDMNPFAQLGIAESMHVNVETLDQNYLQLVRQFHPDQFIHKSQTEQDIAQSYTAQINTAYQALKCPVLRGKHLFLGVFGKSIDEIPDPAPVLMEIFELNEQSMNLNSITQTKDFAHAIETKMADAIRDYDAAIACHDEPNALLFFKTFLYLFKVHQNVQQSLIAPPLD
jgi:molecular chaperone HscB